MDDSGCHAFASTNRRDVGAENFAYRFAGADGYGAVKNDDLGRGGVAVSGDTFAHVRAVTVV
ncbi:hypothetical protein NN3_44470 [Nocardia neocaledoniensis NBRC 108232]|nr:hypothetical protein NN3_44470 [Nocardia neocaledoniensis NBRC 108232]